MVSLNIVAIDIMDCAYLNNFTISVKYVLIEHFLFFRFIFRFVSILSDISRNSLQY